MGANKKTGKPTKAKSSKKTEADEPRSIVFTEEQDKLYGEALATLQDLVEDIQKSGPPIREFAIAVTKMEEAEMWLQRGYENLGLDDDEDPDEGDDDDEDPDEDEDDTE